MELNNLIPKLLTPGTKVLIKSGTKVNTMPGVTGSPVLDHGVIQQLSFLVTTFFLTYRLKCSWVISGAVEMGREVIGGFDKRILLKCAKAAAVGQPLLAHHIGNCLRELGLKGIGQCLYRLEDLRDNEEVIASILDGLYQSLCVPLINYNDAVTLEEIKQSIQLGADNDQLAAKIAILDGAKLVVFFTSIDGFMVDGLLVPSLQGQKEIELAIGSCDDSDASSGGMASKLKSAGELASQGIPSIICNGKDDSVVKALMRLELPVGTICLP